MQSPIFRPPGSTSYHIVRSGARWLIYHRQLLKYQHLPGRPTSSAKINEDKVFFLISSLPVPLFPSLLVPPLHQSSCPSSSVLPFILLGLPALILGYPLIITQSMLLHHFSWLVSIHDTGYRMQDTRLTDTCDEGLFYTEQWMKVTVYLVFTSSYMASSPILSLSQVNEHSGLSQLVMSCR